MIGLNDLTDPACTSQERCLAFSWCCLTFFSDRYWFSQAGFAPRIAHGNVGICVGWTFNVRQPTFVFCFEGKNILCSYTAKRPVNRDRKLLPKGRHNLWAASFLAASTSSCGGKPMLWCDGYLMRVVEHIIYSTTYVYQWFNRFPRNCPRVRTAIWQWA